MGKYWQVANHVVLHVISSNGKHTVVLQQKCDNATLIIFISTTTTTTTTDFNFRIRLDFVRPPSSDADSFALGTITDTRKVGCLNLTSGKPSLLYRFAKIPQSTDKLR